MSKVSLERLNVLRQHRRPLFDFPSNALHEIPGRPHVVFSLRDYSEDRDASIQEARSELAFLFKAFETGQINPKRLDQKLAGQRRFHTIHEYLDWTVTAVAAEDEGDLDFGGFRLIVLLPRFVPDHPPPGSVREEPKASPQIGAPANPVPPLSSHGRPISAATIRCGPGYLEIPFFATHDAKRGRGYGRALLEAVEDVARACGVERLLLCSTNEEHVKATWTSLGFGFVIEGDLQRWSIDPDELLHMENTVKMHKRVPPPRKWRPVLIKHQNFVQRTYVAIDTHANTENTAACTTSAFAYTASGNASSPDCAS